MQQRIVAVETHFQSTRSKLGQEIKQLEKDDHSVRQKSDELPGDQVGNTQEASAEKHVNIHSIQEKLDLLSRKPSINN